MNARLPDIELIKSTHNFPGLYTFKIIGDARADFLIDTLNLMTAALQSDREFKHSIRDSRGGNHTAITLTVRIESAREVHTVYEKLLTLSGLRALF